MSHSVLVADDSLTVRMDLAEAFEAAGFRVLQATTLEEAREVLDTGAVQALVLDVQFPDGDGIDLLREVRGRAATSKLPVLVLSTASEVEDRVRGLSTGADEYVGKPYDSGYVVSKVRDLLRERERGEESRPLVIVVDDSETYRRELGYRLEREGFAVLEAATGEEGLRLASRERPVALVVDGILPGMSGAEVIRHVRLDPALRLVRCVLVTGADEPGAELTALDSGADAFVSKNEDVEVVVARFSAAVRDAPVAPSQGASSLLGPFRILAVDDSPTYLNAVADVLRGEGYDVVMAHSGEEAIELLGVQPVDCILLDFMMPGIGGKEACRRIKSSPALRSIPIVMLTALEDTESMLDALRHGADDFISKSTELEVLTARVRTQIRRKQFEDENRRVVEKLMQTELEAVAARAATELAQTRAALVEELERKNRELEMFSYSVSHDLKAPLRALTGFTRLLQEECAPGLDERALHYLDRINTAAGRMGELVEDLLRLSRVGRAELAVRRVDVSEIAREVERELRKRQPDREVDVHVAEGLSVSADPSLLKIVLENLMDNAWKFTSLSAAARVEVGGSPGPSGTVFFVRDNGAGFDPAFVDKLFNPFQRLHSTSEFPGTGIGLATVRRIVERHGGEVRAEGEVGRGATIYFTLPGPKDRGR